MSDCIIWKHSINSSGYAVKWFESGMVYVHRWIMGAQPGQVVMHICDNKACINPNHLRIGTHADNSQDMVHKNRQAKGEQCGNAKLTEKQVLEIRNLTLPSRHIAKMYGISKTNVLDIKNKKIWRHV